MKIGTVRVGEAQAYDSHGRIVVTPQQAYALDCQRWPTYHDGTPRKQWSALCEIAQWSWSRHYGTTGPFPNYRG
tara:strand:+ start:840 stop:1061 length:222 start_codon:yes stop_codon:yes gene_type:complete